MAVRVNLLNCARSLIFYTTKVSKIFPTQGKRLQFKHNDDNTLQAMADET